MSKEAQLHDLITEHVRQILADERSGSTLLTTEQLSSEIQMSKRTITKWRSEGKGPKYITIGGRVRYHRDDVNEWLNETRKKAA